MQPDVLNSLRDGTMRHVRSAEFPCEFSVDTPIGNEATSRVFNGRFSGHETYVLKVLDYNHFKKFRTDEIIEMTKNAAHDNIIKIMFTKPLGTNYMGIILEKAVYTLDYMLENKIVQERRKMCLELISAVTHLQSQNIMHRNVSPSNVLFYDTGVLKLTGFSRATFVNFKTGKVGEPFYRAPEMAERKLHTKKVDIYSLAIVIIAIMNNRNIEDSRFYKLVNFVPVKEIREQLKNMLSFSPSKRVDKLDGIREAVYGGFYRVGTEKKDTFFAGDRRIEETNRRIRNLLNFKLRCRDCEEERAPYKKRPKAGCNNCGEEIEVPDSAFLRYPSETRLLLKALNKFMSQEEKIMDEKPDIKTTTEIMILPAIEKFLKDNGKMGGYGATVNIEYTKLDENSHMTVAWSMEGGRRKCRYFWEKTKLEVDKKVNRALLNGTQTKLVANSGFNKEKRLMNQTSLEKSVLADIMTVNSLTKNDPIRALFPFF